MFNLISNIVEEKNFIHSVENSTAEVNFYPNVYIDEFNKITEIITEKCEIIELRKQNDHHYYSARYEDFTYYINYYKNIKELYLVKDYTTSYQSFSSPLHKTNFTPEITQINLEDFGLSYVVRLSNGKFIVFDAGRDFPPDHEKLFNCLKKGSSGQPICIAAWILTHAHSDHFFGCIGFMSTYGDQLTVEKMIYNFPEHDDHEHFPGLAKSGLKFGANADQYIVMLGDVIKKYNIEVCTPHTGQIYNIGDAVCEIISSMDDIVHCSNDINASSTVIRMELGGQVILWGADASFSAAKIDKKHGNHLKADILQIPHHGFGCGKEEVLIESYDLIKPKVCFLPVSSYNAYTVFSTFKKSTRHLFTRLDVEEVIVGDPERTISLPYTAPYYAKQELHDKVVSGINNCGANTWIFTDLNTSNPDDFKFTLMNLTHENITIDAELFFETKDKRVRFIQSDVESYCIKHICLTDDESVKTEEIYFNPLSLKKVGITENLPFAVRFMCDEPFVVSHKTHKPAYYTQNIK